MTNNIDNILKEVADIANSIEPIDDRMNRDFSSTELAARISTGTDIGTFMDIPTINIDSATSALPIMTKICVQEGVRMNCIDINTDIRYLKELENEVAICEILDLVMPWEILKW